MLSPEARTDIPESIEALNAITAWIAERLTSLDGPVGNR